MLCLQVWPLFCPSFALIFTNSSLFRHSLENQKPKSKPIQLFDIIISLLTDINKLNKLLKVSQFMKRCLKIGDWKRAKRWKSFHGKYLIRCTNKTLKRSIITCD